MIWADNMLVPNKSTHKANAEQLMDYYYDPQVAAEVAALDLAEQRPHEGVAVGQEPLYYNHKSTGRPPSDSDRYTSKYIDIPWTPLYPFGYGSSYTTFEYGEPRLSATEIRRGDSLVVTVSVTNSGAREGDEVVQLYLRDDVASVTRPVKELRGFRRITLRPGETRMVTFTVTANDLAFHDRAMRRVIEPGSFTVYVGTSSDSTRDARFRVVGDVTPVPDARMVR